MTAPTRMAGWGTAPDGEAVTWTVSEGRKGRRWREVVARGADVTHAVLLETDPEGRFSHLELARADGLWTVHPEGDGTLHGNHVDRSGTGIRHIDGWRFDPSDALVVEGSTIVLAAVAHARSAALAIGQSIAIGAVLVENDGGLRREDALRIERLSATRWQIGDRRSIEIDEAGLPVLDGGQQRPLELG